MSWIVSCLWSMRMPHLVFDFLFPLFHQEAWGVGGRGRWGFLGTLADAKKKRASGLVGMIENGLMRKVESGKKANMETCATTIERG